MNPSPPMVYRLFRILAIAALAAAILASPAGHPEWIGPALIVFCFAAAVWVRAYEFTRGFTFTLAVFGFVAMAMTHPAWFISWNGFQLTRLILPLIQIIMFGMGISLSVSDFARAFRMPKAVGVGILLQFTVMPVAGWLLARMLGFEPEVAAGVVLIGACPGGVASNLMAYLARGNVALSVTMTACSTLVSPLLTPLAMQVLAGEYVPINFLDMMRTILEMIVAPIVLGLIANKLIHGRFDWVDRAMPVVSMAGICLIIAIITANSRDKLLEIGLLVILAAIIHNAIGYVFGYFGARAAGLNESDSRTVAIEVGLQNGGMASGLAINVLKSSDAALAPAIFGPWMNISGSVLASWWRERPADSITAPEPLTASR